MSEEDRRELIARQHRALYGDNASLYESGSSGSRPPSQDVRVPSSGRGASPLAFDPYSAPSHQPSEGAVQMPPRDRTGSTASPVPNAASQPFGLLGDSAPQQATRTSDSSPRASPPLSAGAKGGVAPIGTRPAPAPAAAKRSTTPMTPSGLSYGFSADAGHSLAATSKADERSTSAASNPGIADKGVAGLGSWGGNASVWGAGKGLAVQPSVWG